MVAARCSGGRAAVNTTRRRHGVSLPKRRQFHGFMVLFVQFLALAVHPASPIAEASSSAERATPDVASGPSCPLQDRHPGSDNQQGVLVRVPCVQHLPNHNENVRDDAIESLAKGSILDGSSGGSVGREGGDNIRARSHAIVIGEHAIVIGEETATATTTINGGCYRCEPRIRPAGKRLRSDDRGKKGGLRQPGRGWGGSSTREEAFASRPAREAGFQEQGEGAPATGDDASLVNLHPAGQGFSATAILKTAEGAGGHAAGRGTATATSTVLLSSSSVDDVNGKTDTGSMPSAYRADAPTTGVANQINRDRQVASPSFAPGAELHAASAGSWREPREKLLAVARTLQAEPKSSSVEPDPAPSPAPSFPLASSETAHPVALKTASIFSPITPFTFAPFPDIVAQPFERITFAPYRPLTFAPLADLVPAPTESQTPTSTPDPTPAPFTPPATPEPSPYPTPDPTLAPVTPETDPPTYPPTYPPTPPPVSPPTPAPRTPTPVPDPTPRPTTAPLTPSTPRPAAAPPVPAPSPEPVAPETPPSPTPPTPTETDPPITAPSPQSGAPMASPTTNAPDAPATTTSPAPSVPTVEPTIDPTNVDQSGAPAVAPSSRDVAPSDPLTAPPGSSSPVTVPPASPTYSAPPAVSPGSPEGDTPGQTESTSANSSEDDEDYVVRETIIAVVSGVVATVIATILLHYLCKWMGNEAPEIVPGGRARVRQG